MEILQREEDWGLWPGKWEMGLVLVGAGSCGPCGSLQKKISLWGQDHPEVGLLYIPVERFGALCAQEGIFTVPAVLLYVRGQLTVRESGYFSLQEILQKAEGYLEILKRP